MTPTNSLGLKILGPSLSSMAAEDARSLDAIIMANGSQIALLDSDRGPYSRFDLLAACRMAEQESSVWLEIQRELAERPIVIKKRGRPSVNDLAFDLVPSSEFPPRKEK